MGNETIKRIFNDLTDRSIGESPFETKEYRKMYNTFDKKYIESIEDFNKNAEFYGDFVELIETQKEIAFRVGFKSALDIIFSGIMFSDINQ